MGGGGETTIRAAATAADYAAFAALLADYVAWCRARLADDPGFVDRVFGHQAFGDEVAALASRYGPPNGRTLLAVDGTGAVGAGGAWRRLPDGSCEMKRVFVTAPLQGRGLGRRLCRALIDDAATAGFAVMRIDTSQRFTEAVAMYESLGFRPSPPHHAYPADIEAQLVFMELPLAGRRQGD